MHRAGIEPAQGTYRVSNLRDPQIDPQKTGIQSQELAQLVAAWSNLTAQLKTSSEKRPSSFSHSTEDL